MNVTEVELDSAGTRYAGSTIVVRLITTRVVVADEVANVSFCPSMVGVIAVALPFPYVIVAEPALYERPAGSVSSIVSAWPVKS